MLACRAVTATRFDLEALRAIVKGFARRRLVVWGDLMLDRYLWGRVDRISPEAPVPVVEIERESFSLGGAGNVAANLRALGAEAVLVGVLGRDEDGNRLLEALSARGIDVGRVVRDPDRPTTVKTRIIAHQQQVVRADRERRAEVDGRVAADLVQALVDEIEARRRTHRERLRQGRHHGAGDRGRAAKPRSVGDITSASIRRRVTSTSTAA